MSEKEHAYPSDRDRHGTHAFLLTSFVSCYARFILLTQSVKREYNILQFNFSKGEDEDE
jgi:hypothetical protein